MYDIIIVGAGPAGLTAAIYGRRAGKKVLVLEAKTYGGKIVNTLDIENYPVEEHISGFDFASKLYHQATELGSIIKFEKVKKEPDFKEMNEPYLNLYDDEPRKLFIDKSYDLLVKFKNNIKK